MLDIIASIMMGISLVTLTFNYIDVIKRIIKLENYVNQLPCLSEPVEEKEGENNASKTEEQ